MKDTPENRVKREIKTYLKYKGWFVFHLLQSLGCYPGLPDFIAVKNGHVLFIEAKSPQGKQSDKQIQFEQDLALMGGHYILARSYKDIEVFLNEMNLRWQRKRRVT